VLTDACAGTAFGRSLGSEPSAARGPVQVFIGGLVAEALADGIVRVAVADDQILGAALWSMDHGTGRHPAQAAAVRAASVPRSCRHQLRRLADERCPPGVAHHRLLYLAVRSGRQGEGVGSALLANHHALLHRMHIPTLVIADDLSEPLFERHHYSRIGPPGLLPGGLPMSVMWRDPERAEPS